MILCPNCQNELNYPANASCASCGWAVAHLAGIPRLLALKDGNTAHAESYAQTYEDLACINVNQSNIDRGYLLNQAKNIVRYLGDVTGKSVCDLGVGQGFLLQELMKAGAARVTGVDISHTYLIQYGNDPKLRPVLADAENLPFADEFDVLASTDVMEHVIHLGSFLFCVNRALRAGGIACIRVPFMKTVVHHSKFLGYPHEFGHLRSFDRAVLVMLMESAGFEVVSIKYDGFSLGMPSMFFRKTPFRQRVYARLQSILLRRLERPSDITLWSPSFCRLFMMANEIVVIARKTRQIRKIEPRGYELVPL